jgi:formylglycine-generating enzyme required for sulfatase activity
VRVAACYPWVLSRGKRALKIGSLVASRYKLEKELGRGGMGEVYVATDTKFDVHVALKLAYPDPRGFEDCKLRFRREAVIGRLLGQKSMGFVRALDWGEVDGGVLYLVMDLVVGAKPLDLVSGTRRARVERLLRVGHIVQELHELKIVHRDLKPANILIGRDGSIRLADFGLAKLLGDKNQDDASDQGDLTKTGLALGTPFYMAPEQMDAKSVDLRADIYPLGVMLFQALTTELPFSNQGGLAKFLARQQRVLRGMEPHPRPRDRDDSVPAELDELCVRTMALDAAKRLSGVDPLVAGLTRYLDRYASSATVSEIQAREPNPDLPPTPAGLALVDPSSRTYRNERDGSLLVWVPGGNFLPGDPETIDPQATIAQTRLEGYFLGRFPVTWGQFRRFCAATRRPAPQPSFEVGDDHPVHGVSWHDAQAYCAWANLRLPSDPEWEFAARGEEPQAYPWGSEEPTAQRCNWEGHPAHGRKSTTPVGSFPAGASTAGCLDMAGNVLEWQDGAGGGSRPLRGGSFALAGAALRPARASRLPPEARKHDVGFRVARSLSQQPKRETGRVAPKTGRTARPARPRPAPRPASGSMPRTGRRPAGQRPAGQRPAASGPAASGRAARPRPAPRGGPRGTARRPVPTVSDMNTGAWGDLEATIPAPPPTAARTTRPRPRPADLIDPEATIPAPSPAARPRRPRPRPAAPMDPEATIPSPSPGTRRPPARSGPAGRPRPSQGLGLFESSSPPAASPPPVEEPYDAPFEPVDDDQDLVFYDEAITESRMRRPEIPPHPDDTEEPTPPPLKRPKKRSKRSRLSDAELRLLDHAEDLLTRMASGVSRGRGREIKFSYGPLGYSFVVSDPAARWAFVEQRVTLHPESLEGRPSGHVNLLHACNLITRRCDGMRCLITEDRLRFRRVLHLENGLPESLTGETLDQHLGYLLRGWRQVFGPLRDVQAGTPWFEGLGFLETTAHHGTTSAEVLGVLEGQLRRRVEVARHGDELVLEHGSLRVNLSWKEQLLITLLARPWAAGVEESLAVHEERHAPAVEALLEELNRKNLDRPFSLSWDPKLGVVARTHLLGSPPPATRVLGFLDELLALVEQEELESVP